MYDITNSSSFDNLSSWKKGFLDNAAPKDQDNFPFAIIGNKNDLEDHRKVDKSRGEEWARKNGNCPFFETSAKDG
jgi:GTPase SAR1 family protein